MLDHHLVTCGSVGCDQEDLGIDPGGSETVAAENRAEQSPDEDPVSVLADSYFEARENGDETMACIRSVQVLEAMDGSNQQQVQRWQRIEEEACAYLQERDPNHGHGHDE